MKIDWELPNALYKNNFSDFRNTPNLCSKTVQLWNHTKCEISNMKLTEDGSLSKQSILI